VNELLQGDAIARMAELPPRSVHLVLTDLPYGTTQNKWDSVLPLEALWAAWKRLLVPGGVVLLTGQGPFTARLILSNEPWFKFKLVWEKSKPTNFLNVRHQPLRKHEDVCVFYRGRPTYHPQKGEGAAYDKGVRKDQLTGSYGLFDPVQVKSEGGRWPTDVVYFKTAESEGPVWHPTQKPVALGRYLVRTWSNPGDVVLDNAFGSGSFLVAALAEGRNFVGIERNEAIDQFRAAPVDLVDLARRRLRETWAAMAPEVQATVRAEGVLA